MGDQPFFPPPKPKGAASYREPQERPVTVDDAPPPAPEAKRVVVVRPDEAPKSEKAKRKNAQLNEVLGGIREERGFWFRTSWVATHPRITGFILLVPGSLFSAMTYEAARAHVRSSRGLGMGPFLFTLGLYLLVFGMPIDRETGKPAGWWQVGFLVAVVLAMLVLFVVIFKA